MTEPPRSPLPSIFTLEQIDAVAKTADAVFMTKLMERISDGFIAYEHGDFFAAPIQTMGLPPHEFSCSNDGNNDATYSAQTCVKSGYFKGGGTYVIKVASGGNPLPCNSGLLQIYSQKTGKLEGLLLDEGILTEIRTAAVGALVAKHVMLPRQNRVGNDDDDVNDDNQEIVVGVVGTGIQARYQLHAIQTALPKCKRVYIWGRSSDKAMELRDELVGSTSEGRIPWTSAQVVASANELFQKCNLIVTTTSSREALLRWKDCSSATSAFERIHITCIGADAPGKQELDPLLVSNTNMLIADSMAQTCVRGEFQHAIRQNLIQSSDIIPLGRFLEDPSACARISEGNDTGDNTSSTVQLSIFDSSGVALQDCIIAELVLEMLLPSPKND